MSRSPSILLSTINATYAHPAFGLRCLRANLGDLQRDTRIIEFFRRPPVDRIVLPLLDAAPRILGFGVYIWNVDLLTEVVRRIKAASPDTIIVLGGPEVSFPADPPAITAWADYVVAGEGEWLFPALCRQLRAGERPLERFIVAPAPDPAALSDPYPGYDDEDVAHRVQYVETSRGCPFTCEYCLSSLDNRVRFFPLPELLASLDALLRRGARRFKFIDRTFNLHTNRCVAVLEFFLQRLRPGLSIQFEMVPTRMPPPLRAVIRRFPPGTLRLEVGIQTFSAEVLARIRRHQDLDQTRETLRFLTQETQAVIHADLIAGLPGEDLAEFGRSFDAVARWRPAELQVGILKRLRGAPIIRHDADWDLRYRVDPPYDLLASRLIPAEDMDRMRRFARYWDLVWNRGRFPRTAVRLLDTSPSAFAGFLGFSDWLFDRTGRTHSLAYLDLVEALFDYLCQEQGLAADEVASALAADYRQDAERALPRFLGRHLA